MLAAWPLLIAVVARLPSCSWESGGAVTVAINITSFASPCATDSNSAEKVRSHIRLYLGGSPGFARSGWSAACSSVTASISSPRDLSPAGECSECRRSIFTWLKRRSPTDRRMACPTTGGCQASVLAGYWSAAFVLLIAALSALYARRGTLEHRRIPCQCCWQLFGRILRSQRRPSLATDQQHAGVPEGRRRRRPLRLMQVTEAARRTLTMSVLKDCFNYTAHPPTELPMQRARALLQWRRSLPSRRPALNASRPKRPGTP